MLPQENAFCVGKPFLWQFFLRVQGLWSEVGMGGDIASIHHMLYWAHCGFGMEHVRLFRV